MRFNFTSYELLSSGSSLFTNFVYQLFSLILNYSDILILFLIVRDDIIYLLIYFL